MIPELSKSSEREIGVLPAGIHLARLAEVEVRFATNEHRAWLFDGFFDALCVLQRGGCDRIYLGGSFITGAQYPGDWDAVWDPANAIPNLLNEIMYEPSMERERRMKFRGDLLIGSVRNVVDCVNFACLSSNRDGEPVGLLRIDLKAIELINYDKK